MDKRILLPTDFSKNAFNAIRYALDLYADKKCTFNYLNLYQIDGFAIDGSAYRPEPGERSYEIAKRKSEEQFEKLMQVIHLKYENPNHAHRTFVTYNSLLEGVKDAIAANDIEIIIMGTKGLSGSRTVIFGTNAINIMEKITECPVLAIPEDVRFIPPKEIVFPTDYKKPFRRRELKYMINIAQMHDAFIRVLHVKKSARLNRAQQGNKDLSATLLKDVNHSFHELEGMTVQSGINAFIDSRESDMVAFINRKHSFFGSILSKPLVKELGYYSKVPVLVLKDRS